MGIDFGKAVTKLSSSTIHRSSASNHPANLRLIALLPVCARLSPVRGESSFASMIRRALQGERLEGLAGELIKIAEDENIARSVAQSVVDKITGISKSESA